MKTKLVLIGVGLFVLSVVASRASDTSSYQSYQASQTNHSIFNLTGDDSDNLYRNMEGSIEAFGTGTVEDHHHDYDYYGGYDHHHRHVQGGGGIGGEFFFCRYIGIEAEASSERFFPNFVDDVGGNLVARLPIGNTGLAPYIFGGAGHQFNPGPATYGDAGVGLEYRFTPCIGAFIDARAMLPDHHEQGYGMGRLGVKFVF